MARPTKSQARVRLQRALNAIPELRELHCGSSEFLKWQRDTRVAIKHTFWDNSGHIAEFLNIYFSTPDPFYPHVYAAGLDEAASVLESMIDEIEEYWDDEQRNPPSSVAQEDDGTNTNEVFIIHGRDNEAKEKVARILEGLQLRPVILHEQPNLGRTIIEKFEQHAQVGFAVALLTPDDVGALKSEEKTLKPRARQNVVFELGYFLGRLGRKRVCALTKGNVEIPSDYDGVVYIPLDDAEGWKTKLIKELKIVGFDVDANKAL